MKKYLSLFAIIIISSALVVGVVSAATIISTNISTGGTLSVTGTSTLATTTFSGNVGIGSVTPVYNLDVTGDANITGTYRVNGSPISATSNWTLNGNDIYYTTGRVGLGTTTPGATLDIGGYGTPVSFGSGSNTSAKLVIGDNLNGASGVQMYNANSGSAADFRFAIFDSEKKEFVAFTTPGPGNTNVLLGNARNTSNYIFNTVVSGSGGTARNLTIGTIQATDLIFGTGNNERARINSSGNFGIATTTPATTLDVNGLMRSQVTASTTISCTSTIYGAMEYSITDDHFYGCRTTGWKQLDN